MSELSTADLAGGTPPRRHETEPALQTHDPKFDSRDEEIRTPGSKPSDPTFARSATREQGAPASSGEMPQPGTQQSPRLPNPAATDGAATSDGATAMFPPTEAEQFRSRWMDVQTGFVDEPRSAVEQADGLVAEMMKRLAQVFADERGKLEEQWSRGDDISTEDLRQALRRYRSFMDRLLSV
jgi:hypothetical protein